MQLTEPDTTDEVDSFLSEEPLRYVQAQVRVNASDLHSGGFQFESLKNYICFRTHC
jgi:hypothetical protein